MLVAWIVSRIRRLLMMMQYGLWSDSGRSGGFLGDYYRGVLIDIVMVVIDRVAIRGRTSCRYGLLLDHYPSCCHGGGRISNLAAVFPQKVLLLILLRLHLVLIVIICSSSPLMRLSSCRCGRDDPTIFNADDSLRKVLLGLSLILLVNRRCWHGNLKFNITPTLALFLQ